MIFPTAATTRISTDNEMVPMITPSEVLEFLYCRRFTYFLNVLKIQQYEDRRFKVRKGREVHERRLAQNKTYLRKKLNVIRKESAVYLASPRLHVRGIVDEILWLEDGFPVPVDYKFSQYQERVYKTHRIQIVLYGLLIEETYATVVPRGYISYIRGGSKTQVVELTNQARKMALDTVAALFDIIATEKIPPRTKYRVRCADCCYKNICV